MNILPYLIFLALVVYTVWSSIDTKKKHERHIKFIEEENKKEKIKQSDYNKIEKQQIIDKQEEKENDLQRIQAILIKLNKPHLIKDCISIYNALNNADANFGFWGISQDSKQLFKDIKTISEVKK